MLSAHLCILIYERHNTNFWYYYYYHVFILSWPQIAIETSYWTIFSHVCIWGSMSLYWLYALLVYSEPLYAFLAATFTYVGTTYMMCLQPTFWFTIILVAVILLFPVLGKRSISMDVVPTLTDRVRLLQKKESSKAKKGEEVELKGMRKRSGISRGGSARPGSRLGSARPGTRPGSVRSGYAFAHQEGFGEMITSGRSMRIKDPPVKNGTSAGIKKSKSKDKVDTEANEPKKDDIDEILENTSDMTIDV